MSVTLEVRLPSEPRPDNRRYPSLRPHPHILVRNMSDDHAIHFQFAARIPPGMGGPRPGGICHLTLEAGDDEWKPILGSSLAAATVWATRIPRDPMDDGMGGW
jgi:hypothetical protein